MKRAKRGQGTFLTVAIAGTLAACDAPPPPVEPGVPWELAAYRVETVRSVRYALEFTVPADREMPVEGMLTASVDLMDGARAVVLDFAASPDQVHAVTVNGEPAAHEVRDEHIVIPGSALAAGLNDIGVVFTAGDLSLNRNDEFLYTLFVPDRARYAFPVFDQPNIKGRYRLTMHVPMDWEVVGNGPEIGRDTTDTGVTFRFAETRPIPSYLFSFVAGRFELDSTVRDGRTLRMLHREPDAEKFARNRDAVYDLHATALSWLEEYTQIPYPFDKFDFVLVPSFQYGGMEHPGAILYRESSLLLDPAATLNDLLGRARLIAHETAHMWFGDLPVFPGYRPRAAVPAVTLSRRVRGRSHVRSEPDPSTVGEPGRCGKFVRRHHLQQGAHRDAATRNAARGGRLPRRAAGVPRDAFLRQRHLAGPDRRARRAHAR